MFQIWHRCTWGGSQTFTFFYRSTCPPFEDPLQVLYTRDHNVTHHLQTLTIKLPLCQSSVSPERPPSRPALQQPPPFFIYVWKHNRLTFSWHTITQSTCSCMREAGVLKINWSFPLFVECEINDPLALTLRCDIYYFHIHVFRHVRAMKKHSPWLYDCINVTNNVNVPQRNLFLFSCHWLPICSTPCRYY